MQSATVFLLALVAVVAAEGQFYVPRAYYTIDAEGHASPPVALRRLRRSLGPYPYLADANANANANAWGGNANANANANAYSGEGGYGQRGYGGQGGYGGGNGWTLPSKRVYGSSQPLRH